MSEQRSTEQKLTLRNSYTVPRWCRMHPMEHFDGMGGCWGISHGFVAEKGRDYCRTCSFYSRIAERFNGNGWGAANDLMQSEARSRGVNVYG